MIGGPGILVYVEAQGRPGETPWALNDFATAPRSPFQPERRVPPVWRTTACTILRRMRSVSLEPRLWVRDW